jgi:GTP-binding protein
LGDYFLRHIERTKVLVHLVDPLECTVDSPRTDQLIDPAKVYRNYLVVQKELKDYKIGLWDITQKPQIVVINKIDVTEVRDALEKITEYFTAQDVASYPISAVTGEGVEALRKKVLEVLSRSVEAQITIEPPVKKYNLYNLPGLNRRPVMTKEVKGLIEAPKRRKVR